MRKSDVEKLQKKAKEARAWFHRIKRGGDGEEIWTLKDERPEWVRDMVYEAHDSMMPDDWKYTFIVEALDALEESDDPDEIEMPEEVYTGCLSAWLGSNVQRPSASPRR